MKLIAVKCPQCGADLQMEKDQKTCFCEYCGCRILIDDLDEGQGQTEIDSSAYEDTDGTRLEEAESLKEKDRREVKSRKGKDRGESKAEAKTRGEEEALRTKELIKEQKRARRRKRRRVILLILLALIVYGTISVRISTERRKKLVADLTSSLNGKLEGTDASVNDVYMSRKTFYVDLDAETTQKDRIDALQEEVVSVMDNYAGYEMRLDFFKDFSTVRSVYVNENGIVKVWTDKTNTLSEEKIKSICSAYESCVQAALDGTGFHLFEINYEGDQVYAHIETDTWYRVPVKETADAVGSAVEIQEEVPLILRYSYEGKTVLADFTISRAGSVLESNSALNSIPDEEKESIEQEYIAALKEVCRKNDASLKSVALNKDCLQIEINTPNEKKNDVEKLERGIDAAVEGLTPTDTKIELNHGYSSVKDWTYDKNGLQEGTLDFTD